MQIVPDRNASSNPLLAKVATPPNSLQTLREQVAPAAAEAPDGDAVSPEKGELKEAFQDFVGQTFFSEMIKAFRSTQQPSAYFHGGRAEEIFQGQFDQVLTEELSEASAEKIADPLFELFMLPRPS